MYLAVILMRFLLLGVGEVGSFREECTENRAVAVVVGRDGLAVGMIVEGLGALEVSRRAVEAIGSTASLVIVAFFTGGIVDHRHFCHAGVGGVADKCDFPAE